MSGRQLYSVGPWLEKTLLQRPSENAFSLNALFVLQNWNRKRPSLDDTRTSVHTGTHIKLCGPAKPCVDIYALMHELVETLNTVVSYYYCIPPYQSFLSLNLQAPAVFS